MNWAASRGHWLHRDEMQKAIQSDDRLMTVNIRPRIERARVEAIFSSSSERLPLLGCG